MNDIEALLAALDENPFDLALHAIVADWYEEHGHTAEAYIHRTIHEAKDIVLVHDTWQDYRNDLWLDVFIRPGHPLHWNELVLDGPRYYLHSRGGKETEYWQKVFRYNGWSRRSYSSPRMCWKGETEQYQRSRERMDLSRG